MMTRKTYQLGNDFLIGARDKNSKINSKESMQNSIKNKNIK